MVDDYHTYDAVFEAASFQDLLEVLIKRSDRASLHNAARSVRRLAGKRLAWLKTLELYLVRITVMNSDKLGVRNLNIAMALPVEAFGLMAEASWQVFHDTYIVDEKELLRF